MSSSNIHVLASLMERAPEEDGEGEREVYGMRYCLSRAKQNEASLSRNETVLSFPALTFIILSMKAMGKLEEGFQVQNALGEFREENSLPLGVETDER